MKKNDQWIDDLPKRNVRYTRGSWEELIEKWARLQEEANKNKTAPPMIADGECARLPQILTDVGHTSRWRPGPRVIDLDFLLPGTVIANFKLVNDQLKFPNEGGWHAGLFDQFQHGKVLAYGLPCAFTIFDQYNHPRKPPGIRPMSILPEWYKKANPQKYIPSNRADEFYVVVVP